MLSSIFADYRRVPPKKNHTRSFTAYKFQFLKLKSGNINYHQQS